MVNIDAIMDMLDWNNSFEEQKMGRDLARNIKCINVFLQPSHIGHSKNVWDNCAIILSERQDSELKPYLYQLFKWIEDLNWPGAECIYDRLRKYKRDDTYHYVLKECIDEAIALKNEVWLDNLLELDTEIR